MTADVSALISRGKVNRAYLDYLREDLSACDTLPVKLICELPAPVTRKIALIP